MKVLGFSLGFNSSAAIADESKVLAAISQERVNCVKNTKEFPIDAILKCCEVARVSEIDKIAFSHYQNLTWAEVKKYLPKKYASYLLTAGSVEELLHQVLMDNGITWLDKAKKIERYDHHQSHLAAAFQIYGEESKYVGITSDGFGDGISARITMKADDSYAVIAQRSLVDSVALIYQFFTGALGFKMHQHEGKLTGLASYGDEAVAEEIIKEMVSRFMKESNGLHFVDVDKLPALSIEEEEQVRVSEIIAFDKFLRLKNAIFGFVDDMSKVYGRAEIACALQMYTERETVGWIKRHLKGQKTEDKICYLSGGLFANVKLNQRIKETGLFREVAVAPPMGDEGTAIGATYICLRKYSSVSIGRRKRSMARVLSGSYVEGLTNEEIANLESEGYKVKKFENSEHSYMEQIEDIVAHLANKEIVCLCRGRMEFGPRALCHRTILYDCSERETNDWLNKQLGRTEFMPFAPVCLDRFAKDLFKNIDADVDRTAKFMTMTFDATDEFAENYKAACHIDGTARPQVVTVGDCDMFIYGLLRKYFEATGKKALINTSFNLHNHPIIESKEVAIDSWKKSNTDVLVINNCVISK